MKFKNLLIFVPTVPVLLPIEQLAGLFFANIFLKKYTSLASHFEAHLGGFFIYGYE